MATFERQILLAPGPIARAAARLASEPEQRWMLGQPVEIRRSYAAEVLDRPQQHRRPEAWMLRQPAAVRESFVEEVLGQRRPLPRQQIWMLRQPDDVRASYVREVLEAEDERVRL